MKLPKFETIKQIEPGIRQVRLTNGRTAYFVLVSKRLSVGKTKRPQRQGYATSLVDARELKRRLFGQLETLEKSPPSRSFKEAVWSYIERIKFEKAPVTIITETGNIKKHFLPRLKDRPISQITNAECRQVLAQASEGLSTQSKRHLRTNLSNIFKHCLEQGWITTNPCDGIKTPPINRKDPVTLTRQQTEKLFLELEKVPEFFEMQVYVLAAYHLAARIGELRALTWQDVDFESNQITISKTLDPRSGPKQYTKNWQTRQIWINSDLKKILDRLRPMTYHSPESPLLPYWLEARDNEQAKALKAFCAAIGLPPIKFHEIRAISLTRMLASGKKILEVMRTAGHKRLSSTQVYLRLSGIEVKGTTDGLCRSNNTIIPDQHQHTPDSLVQESDEDEEM